MGYHNDSSSSNLKPVLLSVSAATTELFGGMYFYYTHSASSVASGEAMEPAQAQQAQSAMQPLQSTPPAKTLQSTASATKTPAAISAAVKPRSRTRV